MRSALYGARCANRGVALFTRPGVAPTKARDWRNYTPLRIRSWGRNCTGCGEQSANPPRLALHWPSRVANYAT